MDILLQSQYENIRSFFHSNYPNLPLIYGIIEGLLPGEIWVDHVNNPTSCLIMTGGAYCFMSGKINEKIFLDYLAILKKKELIKLAIESNNKIELSAFDFVPVARRQYRYKNLQSIIPVYENTSGFTLKKIDEDLFDLCAWKPLVLSLLGDIKNYLKNSVGFILWDDEKKQIASEVHGIPSRELIELGTATHEDYRGKKLSTILCNYFIRYVVKKGLQPVWSCDEANIFSWKIAEKQGMDDLINYLFYIKENK